MYTNTTRVMTCSSQFDRPCHELLVLIGPEDCNHCNCNHMLLSASSKLQSMLAQVLTQRQQQQQQQQHPYMYAYIYIYTYVYIHICV